MDSLVSGQLQLRPPPQIPVSVPIQACGKTCGGRRSHVAMCHDLVTNVFHHRQRLANIYRNCSNMSSQDLFFCYQNTIFRKI